ncbi:FUSC family protein [Paraburkholderia sp. BR14263]|uniref:FUSC family protein n=1 Tax=unclassified Paraburkholderia TaxID=2615204 RepID=UPI0034CF6A93
MLSRLINWNMLLRAAALLVPIFIVEWVTGDTKWLSVPVVTVSAFVAVERGRLAPLGAVLYALAIGVAFVAVTASYGTPAAYIGVSVLLAAACASLLAGGSEMRWTGFFAFIPVMYFGCETARGAHGHAYLNAGIEAMPYALAATLPVIVASIVSYATQGEPRSERGWLALRLISEPPSPGLREAIVAGVLAVGLASALAALHPMPYQEWFVWSAFSVVTGDWKSARSKWRDRLAGTIVGVPAGVLVAMLLPHSHALANAVEIAIALELVAFHRYVVAFGVRCAMHGAAIVISGHTWLCADARLIDVALGSTIGILFVLAAHEGARSLRRNNIAV